MPICIYGGYPFRAGPFDSRRRKRRRSLRARPPAQTGYCSTTAVPLTVTISMLALPPTVS